MSRHPVARADLTPHPQLGALIEKPRSTWDTDLTGPARLAWTLARRGLEPDALDALAPLLIEWDASLTQH